MRIGFESTNWTGLWMLLFPPASSTSASQTRISFGLQNDEGVIHETSSPTHSDHQRRLVEHPVRGLRGRRNATAAARWENRSYRFEWGEFNRHRSTWKTAAPPPPDRRRPPHGGGFSAGLA